MSQERFWNSPGMQPKRSFTWLLTMGSGETGIAQHIARTAQRPTYNVNEAEHNYLNHKFWYPGTVEWDPIDITIVDPISHNAAEKTKRMILESGYQFPTDPPNGPQNRQTVSKKNSVEALGRVTLDQLRANGEVVDSYDLVNAWLQTIDYSEFDYSSDDLAEITMTVRFDYAIINNEKTGQSNIRNSGGSEPGLDELLDNI